MAQNEDLYIDQGADVAVELRLVNTDKTKKDLTGYTVKAQMRKTVNTSDSDAITFTSIVADPSTDGIATLTLTNTQTDAIKAGRYFYDVELSHLDSDANSIIERVLQGHITVTPSITRS
jgi:hypothetical protein